MHLLITLFWNALGGIVLLTSLMFLIYTMIAGTVLLAGVFDRTLSIKDRILLILLMTVTVFWGGWLTSFSFHLGQLCLTN